MPRAASQQQAALLQTRRKMEWLGLVSSWNGIDNTAYSLQPLALIYT
jgi:hypothetical protein